MPIKQGLPSHQHITPEEPTPEEHQRILYPDIRAARQQCWARNSEPETQILKQQDQIYLSTSHTQVCASTSASKMMCQAMSTCGVVLGSVPQSSSWAQLPSNRPPGEDGTSQHGERWLSVIPQMPKIMNKCSTKSIQLQPSFKKGLQWVHSFLGYNAAIHIIASHFEGILHNPYSTNEAEQWQRLQSRNSGSCSLHMNKISPGAHTEN